MDNQSYGDILYPNIDKTKVKSSIAICRPEKEDFSTKNK